MDFDAAYCLLFNIPMVTMVSIAKKSMNTIKKLVFSKPAVGRVEFKIGCEKK
jgi:hypothetical protein